MDTDALKQHFADLSDEALSDVVNGHPGDYTEEALLLARAELLARKAPPDEAVSAKPEDRTPERMQSKGAQWFTVVGVLSLVNTIFFAFATPEVFLFGLAVTHLLEVCCPGGAAVTYAIDAAIAVVFLVIGYLARTSKATYVIGITAYAVDAVLALLLGLWAIFFLHVVVLVILYVRLIPALERGEPQQAGDGAVV